MSAAVQDFRAQVNASEALRKEEEHPKFRLVVTRGKLGVELDGGFSLGPLSVEQLAAIRGHAEPARYRPSVLGVC